MIPEPILEKATDYLSKATGAEIEVQKTQPVSGGSINNAAKITTNQGDFFVKWNHAARYPGMFEAEARGLGLLRTCSSLFIPEIIAVDEANGQAFLLMEFVESGATASDFWEDFGTKLAKMHMQTHKYYGLDHDNYIGSLPQSNTFYPSWVDFFVEERLEAQCKMARDSGKIGESTLRQFEQLYTKLDELIPTEPAALVHGDLWSGNFMIGPDGKATLIDPAIYYGHREMDIGMSKLFGGFNPEFYNAYNVEYPLEEGWEDRIDIANLYPLMVHVNLFGGGYLGQVQSILSRFA